ncbi:MAG: BON domain-containing protein [Rhodospirillales bacterium]|nr:BON domain-containing protein [Rhodospirillales bacterium]
MSHGVTARSLVSFIVLLALSPLAGCGPMVGAGATAGVAAYDERGIDGVSRDFRTANEIRGKLLEKQTSLPFKISVEVYEGRALLTGVVQEEQARADVVALAWQVSSVRRVLNEIQVRPAGSVVDFTHDAWITTQLQSKITFDKNILGVNYSVETVNGVLYLIGIAQDQAELDRVIAYARSIERVREVVSHVRLKRDAAA